MQRFLSELQRRKVLRIASAYVVAGWIVLQVSLALQTAMNLPAWFSTVIVSLLIIAFPITLVATWFLEITPEGISRTTASGDGALVKPQTTDFILAAGLALVLVVALVQALMPRDGAPAATTTTVEAPKPKPEPPALGDKSIAVLPFTNLSPDKEDAYFADGLTEEILNALSQIQSLRVISRTSSFAFKGKNVPLRDIAQQLSVRYVLEGSVRRDGDDVRITAQLIDAATDAHIWSKTFEPKLNQIFAAQAEISGAIALAMEVQVELADGVGAAPTKNLEAYTLYLKGRELMRRAGEGDYPQAIELMTRATELDPGFVEARVALAFRYMNLIVADPLQFKNFVPMARRTAEAIRKQNPKFPGALAFLANVEMGELRWADAVNHVTSAVHNDPSNAVYRVTFGSALLRLGFLDRAVDEFAEARRLDPLNQGLFAAVVYGAFARGDDDIVSVAGARASAIQSEYSVFGHWLLAMVAQRKGDHAEADRQFRAFMTDLGKQKTLIEPVSLALSHPGAVPTAVAAILREQKNDPIFNAGLLLQLIDPGGATVDFLQEMLKQGDTFRASFSIPVIWRYAVDKGANARIKKLFRDLGLVDYWKKHGWPDRCRAKGEADFECS